MNGAAPLCFMAFTGTAKCVKYRLFYCILILLYFSRELLVVECFILNIILYVASSDELLLPATGFSK